MTHHGHDHHRNDHVHEPPGDAHRDAHSAHDKHAGHSVEMFRNRFWLTLLLTIPTIIWSGMIQHWFGYRAPRFPGSAYVPAIFGTIVYVYGGSVFLQGAWRELRGRLPGMMTLISLAITVAFLFSVAVTLRVAPGDGPVVGTGDARGHHAARPLGRDALGLAGAGRAEGTRQAAARHRPAHRSRRPRQRGARPRN